MAKVSVNQSSTMFLNPAERRQSVLILFVLLISMVIFQPGILDAQTSSSSTSANAPKPQAAGNKASAKKVTEDQLQSEIDGLQEQLSSDNVQSDANMKGKLEAALAQKSCELQKAKIVKLDAGITAADFKAFDKSCQQTPIAVGAVELLPEGKTPGWCTFTPTPTSRSFAPIQAQSLPDNDKDFDGGTRLNASSSGREITTKSVVEVGYANRLRYDVSLGGVTTPIPMPDISAVFGFKPTTASGSPGATNSTALPGDHIAGKFAYVPKTPPSNAEQEFRNNESCLTDLMTAMNSLEQEAATDVSHLNSSVSAIKNRLGNGSAKVYPSGDTVRSLADDQNSQIFPRTLEDWPGSSFDSMIKLFTDLKASFDKFKKKYATDPFFKGTNGQANTQQFDDDVQAVTANVTTLTQQQKDTQTDYATNLQFVMSWYDKFSTVANAKNAQLIETFGIDCRNWFGQGSKTAMQLTTHDRLNPTVADVTANLDTVLCNSPVTVTSGLGISFVPDRTPAFVPAAPVPSTTGTPALPTTDQALGYSSDARVRPAYAIQVNTALYENEEGWFGLHASAGSQLTAATSGATLDLMAGLGFSLRRRTIFISPMFDLGHRTDYIDGFFAGEPKGMLTTPPTVQRWKPGFAFTITFPFSVGNSTQPSSNSPAPSKPKQ